MRPADDRERHYRGVCDGDAIIICLTNSPDFAVQSHRFEAFDYVIMTRETSPLESALARAVAALTAKEAHRLHSRS